MESVIEQVKKIEDAKSDVDVRVIRRIEIGNEVALGTGNGSRHMASGEVRVFKGKKLPTGVKIKDVSDETIMGPCIKADAPWALTHPEHAHHHLPKGTYKVVYQYDPRTMRRVAD